MTFNSRSIHIGNLALGGKNPIRLQSMTSTNTMDTIATVEQCIRMINAGCGMIRITAQGIKEAENLSMIKNELGKKGYTVPIIADIHFNPKAAETAARIVEKIRINPGNYVDRNRGRSDYPEIEYKAEISKIKSRLTPLIHICKKHGTAMRIGSNHGSLSDRILNRYGDTPLGMVESALEFIRICVEQDFFQLVISMKASNVKTMVQANRLLVKRMKEEGFDFPIHLGVTEAGDGEDGRIKSAAGIATLLSEGIGDTIRVSLTEEPEFELPVAKLIAGQFKEKKTSFQREEPLIDPYHFKRRETYIVGNIGAGQPPVVIIGTDNEKVDKPLWDKSFHPDFIVQGKTDPAFKNAGFETSFIQSPSFDPNVFKAGNNKDNLVIIIDSLFDKPIDNVRKIIYRLMEDGISAPIVLRRKFKNLSADEFTVRAASDFGSLLIDGLLDGIWIESASQDMETVSRVSFGILQATGDRSFKTEYIACPSCGRTLFNIQETLSKIKQRTSHLKGLKIGVMGCIVNGPGEMADAHFGYVGAGSGKISLYKSNRLVKKNINEDKAVDELIGLIRENGFWKEPEKLWASK
ncbi:MAG: (E)-4-hydroxy-3-methylbut-2-enyl-diphosphate synthase [Chlorobi bacterium]|nr:(E)-4-hydroxy-3-methylbut-2-enyl-diphosphate synthase [Chlorobiota bacterium]